MELGGLLGEPACGWITRRVQQVLNFPLVIPSPDANIIASGPAGAVETAQPLKAKIYLQDWPALVVCL